jgi:hypothetical protein
VKVPGGLGYKFGEDRHMKAVKLSALRTSWLWIPGNISGTHLEAESTTGPKCGRNLIGNQTRDLPVCSSAVPQPSAPHMHRIYSLLLSLSTEAKGHSLYLWLKLLDDARVDVESKR